VTGTTLFLEIVGDAGGDGVAGDSLAALAGEQNKREVRIFISDGL